MIELITGIIIGILLSIGIRGISSYINNYFSPKGTANDTQKVSYRTNEGYYQEGTFMPIDGNPDLKTCPTPLLVWELQNRSACTVVGYIEQIPVDDEIVKRITVDYSGDPIMAKGLTDKIAKLMQSSINDIPAFRPFITEPPGDDDLTGEEVTVH